MKQWLGSAHLAVSAALAGSLALAGAAQAQDETFPASDRPITIIVPYAAGGTTDGAGRILADRLEDALGTTVQIVNKPGAASQVALTELVTAEPDGYTLSYGVLPTIFGHYLDPKRGAIYDRESFQPVAHHHLVPAMIAVRSDSPYQTLDDLVAAARDNPEEISISDSGLRGNPHTAVLMLQDAADVRFGSVHFDGGAPSVTALLGGHVDALAGGVSDAVPHVRSGDVRVLGVAAEERSPFLPDAPTMKEQGYDVVTVSATGILAPAGTPMDRVETLSSAMKEIIESDEHAKRLQTMGVETHYMPPEEYAQFWEDYEARIRKVFDFETN